MKFKYKLTTKEFIKYLIPKGILPRYEYKYYLEVNNNE